jgi:hypothetical protein
MSLYSPFAFQNKQDIEPFRFLLDEIPNAQAAYSLRQLSSTYTGDCIRVKRSSDNAEADFGFTSRGLLDTAAILSFVGGGDGIVVEIKDQSQNGTFVNNLFDVGSAAYIVKSGVVQTNSGRPAMKFDVAGGGFQRTGLPQVSTTNATITTVQNPFGSTTWIPQMCMGPANGSINYQLIRITPPLVPGGLGAAGMYRGNTTTAMCVNGTYLSGTEVHTCTQDGIVSGTAEAKLWRNGSQVTITNDTNISGQPSTSYIGMGADPYGQRFCEGYHQEAVAWFTTKTPSDVDTINEIANEYYSIY